MTIETVTRQAIRAEINAVKNRLSAAVSGAGALAVAECFDGTASNLVAAALTGVAIFSALKSDHASQIHANLRQTIAEDSIRIVSE